MYSIPGISITLRGARNERAMGKIFFLCLHYEIMGFLFYFFLCAVLILPVIVICKISLYIFYPFSYFTLLGDIKSLFMNKYYVL